MRSFTKDIPTELINVQHNFNDFNSKKDKQCQKPNESLITELLDMRDRDWQHTGYKEQFENLREHLFKQLIQIVLQTQIKMVDVTVFFGSPISVQTFKVHMKSCLPNSFNATTKNKLLFIDIIIFKFIFGIPKIHLHILN